MVIARNSNLLWKITILVMVSLCVNTATALDGSGTEQDPWRIKSLEDFNEFASDANYWDGWTRLETDVNMAGLTYTTAVIAPDTSGIDGFQGTAFTGVFDGNDHKIIGLSIDDGGTGNDYLGLFAYVDEGQLSNLAIECISVSGGRFGRFVGGVVGSNSGSISNCYSTGSVNGAEEVGGLVGINAGSVSNCHSTGDVNGVENIVGGLAGVNSGSISNCYSTSDVDGVEDAGGLVGSNGGNISDCNSSGTVRGVDHVGGLVGTNYSGSVSNCYSTSNVTGSNCSIGGLVGSNNHSGSIVSNCYATGNADGFRIVGGLIGENRSDSVSNCYSTGDVNGVKEVGGLVGSNYGSIWDCDCTGDVTVDRYNAGGLVGYNNGSLSNCYSKGDISGDNYIGGLVGLNELGSVSNCYSTGNATGTGFSVGGLMGKNHYASVSNCYSKGDVSGDSWVGGLLGESAGSISNCYSIGDVSGSHAGGLVGWNDVFEISNCFWDTNNQTHGVTESIGMNDGTITNVAGLPTDQMQTQVTFTGAGWNFINTWNIGENQTYPYLRTVPASDINKDRIVNFLDVAITANQWMEGVE